MAGTRWRRGEQGGGPVSMAIGFLVFMVMLLTAVQVILRLYATSVVTAAANDAARQVAGSRGGPSAIEGAEHLARAMLGRYGQAMTFDWSATDTDSVVLRVTAGSPHVLPALTSAARLDRVDRTVKVRIERFR